MIKLFSALCAVGILSCNTAVTQSSNINNEFRIYSNGLIYDDTTMHQLSHIVDSLNLQFKRCDLTRQYYAVSQGIGHFISIKKGNSKAALADLELQMPFTDFIKKYKSASVTENMLIIKSRYKNNYENRWFTQFDGQMMKDYDDPEIRIEDNSGEYNRPLKGQWIINDRASGYLEAFYITTEFVSPPIPLKYARMILYADCVVDTTAEIFSVEAGRDDRFSRHTNEKDYRKTKLFAFTDFLDKQTSHISEKNVPAVYGAYKWLALDSLKKAWVKQELSGTEKFKTLLVAAVQEFREKKLITNDTFEECVGNYFSKKDALAMKRNRRVIGNCSMDQSPRYHALNIAMLSAETVNWEVFLRAHLDIMNDRFERITDGSYAWGRRNTYIKELEELNIDVQDLLLGISLRMENPVSKHYYGSIGRLGRALAETRNSPEMEARLLNAIKDNQLDTYNRLLLHYLYLNYTWYLSERKERLTCLDKLEEADKTLPEIVKGRIKIERKNFEDKK
ncbi:MAG: hypothetical protein ABI760_08200 [Ferruginibacter sp.]